MKFDHRFTCVKAAPTFREYAEGGVRMRLDFIENMLRVALIREDVPLLPTWSVWPGEGDCPPEGRDRLSTEGFALCSPEAAEEGGVLRFSHADLRFEVELKNFRISVHNEKGLLYQDRDGLAYNFAGELGDGTVHFTRREPGERIFGLGDKSGSVNKAGLSFAIGAGDAMGFSARTGDPLYKQVPFYICENTAGAYGIYYDTYSNGRIDLGQEHDNYFESFKSARFEEENQVFYLIFGTIPEIVRRFSALCGTAAPVPKWAFSYCGSTMAYTDADDADDRLRGFVRKCEENGIRARGFYLSSGYTQIGQERHVFHWNTEKIPSPEGLAAYFREHGMELIPNVKPAFLTTNPLYGMIAQAGWFLHYADGSSAVFPFWGGMASYLDFTNPGACAFWKACVRKQLVDKGYTNIWNDNNEYDVWDKDVLADGFGKEVPARRIRPLFSYLMARASREACLDADPAAVPFNVSRCGIAGTWRAASTWTGDNLTAWEELRYNHCQAMTLSLSGFSFFGPDIGGFAGPSPEPELFLRWLQYGVFLPRFVLHSWKPGEEPTMPWLYPEKMDAVKKLFALREKLVPYLYEEAERCRKAHEPLIRPVFFAQPDYDCEADCFFCGERILACPVFDKGKEAVTVRLPENASGWRLRGEGKKEAGGTVITVSCRPEDEPVWFEKT